MFLSERSHFILEVLRVVNAAASITPESWAPVPASSVRYPIRVQDRGSERLFVSWSSNLGSALP
jgi:hypothetical protein